MAKNLPVKKQHSWKTGLLLFDMCTLPLGPISPAFIQTTLTCFASPSKDQQRTRKQETKKPKNKETKKLKKQETKKIKNKNKKLTPRNQIFVTFMSLFFLCFLFFCFLVFCFFGSVVFCFFLCVFFSPFSFSLCSRLAWANRHAEDKQSFFLDTLRKTIAKYCKFVHAGGALFCQ